jgi:hypothetical protein
MAFLSLAISTNHVPMSIPASSSALYIHASQVTLFSGYSDGIFALLLQTLFRNWFRLATSSSILVKKFLRSFTLEHPQRGRSKKLQINL